MDIAKFVSFRVKFFHFCISFPLTESKFFPLMDVSVFVNVNHTVISVPVSSPRSTTALRCASVIIDAWA